MNQKQLENVMDEYLVKKAPFQLPEGARKWLVAWAPWLSLIGGIIGLLGSLSLWRAAHTVNTYMDATNEWLRAYGAEPVKTRHLGILFYIALIVLLIQSLLALYAIAGLKAKSKAKGWNIVLLSVLLSFVYGVFSALTDYGSLGNFVFSVIGLVIGLYILAQVKTYYNGSKKTQKSEPKST